MSSPRTVSRLTHEQMLSKLKAMNPATSGLGSDAIDTLLVQFCLNCPDPVGAMDVVLEAPRDMSDREVLEQALALPARPVESFSPRELAIDHPLRTWRVE